MNIHSGRDPARRGAAPGIPPPACPFRARGEDPAAPPPGATCTGFAAAMQDSGPEIRAAAGESAGEAESTVFYRRCVRDYGPKGPHPARLRLATLSQSWERGRQLDPEYGQAFA